MKLSVTDLPAALTAWRASKGLWVALGVCLIVRLVYLIGFGDKLTAFGYENGFALQALALLDGRGLETIDSYVAQVDQLQFTRLPFLLQPRDYPPPPPNAHGYYHATDMPGYPWILAALWAFTDHPSFWPAKILQALASVLLIFPIWDMARRMLGNRCALLSAWLYALWLPSAYLSQMASKESWEIVFAVLTAWFTLRYFMQGRWWDLALGALSLVLATYLRANLLVLTAALCGVGLLTFPWRRILTCFIVTHLFLALCLAPWVARNHRWVGPQVGLKEGFYWGILGGLAMHDAELAKEVSRIEARRTMPDGSPCHGFREPPEVPEMTQKILKQKTAWYLGLVARRVATAPWFPLDWGYGFFKPEVTSLRAFRLATGKGFSAYVTTHPLGLLFKTAARGFEVAVGTLALAAFWFCRTRWRECLWIATCYWVFIGVYAPVHIEFRYIASHTWPLLILTAACLAKLMPKPQNSPSRSTPAENP
jgi:hypothetical protein